MNRCHEKGIPLYTYDQPDVNSLLKLQFNRLTHLKYPYVLPKHTEANFLWDISWLLDTSNGAPPNWSGFMRTVSVGLHNPKS